MTTTKEMQRVCRAKVIEPCQLCGKIGSVVVEPERIDGFWYMNIGCRHCGGYSLIPMFQHSPVGELAQSLGSSPRVSGFESRQGHRREKW